jgi:hypothetical protein
MSIIDDLRSKSTDCHESEEALYRRAAEEIWCLREVVRGVRIMANAGKLAEWDDEPWLKRVRNIDLES